MALISCPECSKVVSDQAFVCPNCGYPLNAQIKVAILKTVKTITEIAKNIFSFIASSIFLVISIGVLTYFAIKAFDFFSKNFLK